jgi:hypothetical protein
MLPPFWIGERSLTGILDFGPTGFGGDRDLIPRCGGEFPFFVFGDGWNARRLRISFPIRRQRRHRSGRGWPHQSGRVPISIHGENT